MTPIYFYRTEAENEPVREWLKVLDRKERKIIGDDLQTVQLGWKRGVIAEPLVKSFGAGLFEVRISLPSRRIARIFFCEYESKLVLLHAFIKKTKQTPDSDRDLAIKRQKSLRK